MSLLGITALALLLTWLLGGFPLRFGGLMLVFVGSIGLAVSANANGILIASVGALVWLLGHGHYALCHGVWKSRLAGWLWSSAGSALGWLLGPPLRRLEADPWKGELGRERGEAEEV